MESEFKILKLNSKEPFLGTRAHGPRTTTLRTTALAESYLVIGYSDTILLRFTRNSSKS